MADPAKVLFRNASYDGQLTRTLAAAMAGSADLGEALATARRIGKPNGAAWYDAWSGTASQARQTAEKARASGDRVDARHGFLQGQRVLPPGLLLPTLGSRRPPPPGRLPRPRRHVQSGYRLDGPPRRGRPHPLRHRNSQRIPLHPRRRARGQADCHLSVRVRLDRGSRRANVPAALERGYNALVFEGPGQGDALYTQRLFLRPDFEHVLTPVLDWLLTRPEVHPDALVLIGRSFAGYLAPRAACFEHRLAALVCDPAQPDMGARIPGGLADRSPLPS